MQRYDVELIRTETKSYAMWANSPEEAVEKAERLNDGFRAESVEDTEVLGKCEDCAKVLLSNKEYVVDSDGCRMCMDCAKACAASNK